MYVSQTDAPDLHIHPLIRQSKKNGKALKKTKVPIDEKVVETDVDQ